MKKDLTAYELIEECVEIIRWRETGLLQQGGYLQARAEKLSYVPDHIRLRVAEENVCMDAMRFVASALPLPVSPVKSCAEPLCEDEGCPHYGTPHHCISSPVKESRDAVIEECATVASQYPTPAALAIAANIRALKSKQPSDTGAGK